MVHCAPFARPVWRDHEQFDHIRLPAPFLLTSYTGQIEMAENAVNLGSRMGSRLEDVVSFT